jgi:hypothetical protein
VLEPDGGETLWPALVPGVNYPWRDEPLDPHRLAALWTGEADDPAPIAAVTGTAAVALKLLGRARDVEGNQKLAERMWRERDRSLPGGEA